MESALVGYGKTAARAGYQKRAAVPWGDDLLGRLLSRMDADLPSSPLQRSYVQRDMTMLCLMFQLGQRGQNVGFMWARDLTDEGGAALPLFHFRPAEGSVWTLRLFTKTRKQAPSPPTPLTYTAQEGRRETNALWRLEQYLNTRRELNHPAGDVVFVSCHLKPTTSQALQKRFHCNLAKLGLDGAGYTLHGLKRGLVQKLAHANFSQEAIMDYIDMRSQSSYQLYHDSSRPTRAPV